MEKLAYVVMCDVKNSVTIHSQSHTLAWAQISARLSSLFIIENSKIVIYNHLVWKQLNIHKLFTKIYNTLHYIFVLFLLFWKMFHPILVTKYAISTALIIENPVRSPMVPPIADNMSVNFAALSLVIVLNVGVSK